MLATKYKTGARLVLLAALIILAGGYVYVESPGLSGTDLFAYWSSVHLFLAGGNPYNAAALLQAQQHFNPALVSASMVWNPPCLLLLLAPFLTFDLGLSRIIWGLVTLTSCAASVWISWRLMSTRKLSVYTWMLISFSFYPLWTELRIGQVSSFIVFLFLFGLYNLARGRDFAAGFFGATFIIKPHLFFLPALVCLIFVVKEKRWRVMTGVLAFFCVTILLTELIFPGINLLWFSRKEWPVAFLGSSLVSILRQICIELNQRDLPLLAGIIPGLSAIAFVCWWRRSANQSFLKIAALSALLSPLLAPYGYTFDQTLLILPQTYIMAEVSEARASELGTEFRLGLLLFLSISAVLIEQAGITIVGLPMWWFAYPIMLGVFWLMRSGLKRY